MDRHKSGDKFLELTHKEKVWCSVSCRLLSFPRFLNKIRLEEVDTILVVPHAAKVWTPLLEALPIAAACVLEPAAHAYTLGSHVPEYMRMEAIHLHLEFLIGSKAYKENLPSWCG